MRLRPRLYPADLAGAGGAYVALPQTPWMNLRGCFSAGSEGQVGGEERREGKGKERKRRKRKGGKKMGAEGRESKGVGWTLCLLTNIPASSSGRTIKS